MTNFDLMNYLKYNKIETGIYGFNKLLYGGLVIPYDENFLIVIRGGDDTEKPRMVYPVSSIFSHGS